jgi:hypothetical protein
MYNPLMEKISIISREKRGNGYLFLVRIGDKDYTEHKVSIPFSYLKSPLEDIPKKDLIIESFRFLLDREPKENILKSFELEDIGRYFPEYEDYIKEKFIKDKL